jgi:hypothetical protein
LFGLDWTLLVVLPLDSAVRYGEVIHGDSYPAGFLEWLFKRQKPLSSVVRPGPFPAAWPAPVLTALPPAASPAASPENSQI